MLINFVDFKKAFDSVHRESLWKIMKSYEIPQRIIDIIQNFYDGRRCASEAWRRDGRMVSDQHGSAAGMCLVTADLCPGGGLGDDKSYECKGYWNQMGHWRQAGRPRLCR